MADRISPNDTKKVIKFPNDKYYVDTSVPENKDGDGIIALLAAWDEALGPEITDQLPLETDIGDLDMLAVPIFMTFQTIFGEAADVTFHHTTLTMPFKSHEKIARILLDTIPDEGVRGGLMPFIVVLLLPDYLPEDKVAEFDDVMARIGTAYKETQSKSIHLYNKEMQEVFKRAMEMDEIEITLDPSYTLTGAISDFKQGIQYFQKRNWEDAYTLLRKAFEKFTLEKQQQLVMESTYLIATCLIQLKKFQGAIPRFQNLYGLAEDIQHQKYSEISRFMLGYTYSKLNRGTDAAEWLDKITPESSKFVNLFQYYSIQGQIHAKLEKYPKSIGFFESALDVARKQKVSPTLRRQQGQILYDLGTQQHNLALLQLKTSDILSASAETSGGTKILLKEAIENLSLAADVWVSIEESKNAVYTLRRIGNLYGFLQNTMNCVVLWLLLVLMSFLRQTVLFMNVPARFSIF